MCSTPYKCQQVIGGEGDTLMFVAHLKEWSPLWFELQSQCPVTPDKGDHTANSIPASRANLE